MNNNTTIDKQELKLRLEALQQLADQGFEGENALKAIELAALGVFKATVVLRQTVHETAQEQVPPMTHSKEPEVDEPPVTEEIIEDVNHGKTTESSQIEEGSPLKEETEDEAITQEQLDEGHEEKESSVDTHIEETDLNEEPSAEQIHDAKAEINQSFSVPKDMGDGISYSPIDNLKKAIGLNDRFMFANELFNGFGEEYAKAIEEFNHLESMEDAERLIEAKFAQKYHWDSEDETVQLFKRFLYRRYLANS